MRSVDDAGLLMLAGGDSGDQLGQVPEGAARAGRGGGPSRLSRERHVQAASKEQELGVGDQDHHH